MKDSRSLLTSINSGGVGMKDYVKVSLTPQDVVDMYDLLIDHDIVSIGGRVKHTSSTIEVTEDGFYLSVPDEE